MTQTAHVVATVTLPGQKPIAKAWKGRDMSIRRLRQVAKKKLQERYPEARISVSGGWYTNDYGAH